MTEVTRGDGDDVQSDDPVVDVVVAGRYRLIKLIAAGGMGRVWLARDVLLDRAVAVKEVLAPHTDAADLMLGTVREASAAARLDHPSVVRIFDVVQATGRAWIVMEYVPSRSLQDVLTEDGPLTHRHAARVGLAVLDALIAAHRAGVLHRDVKPRNVLIGTDGRVVLTDFGLATIAAAATGRAEPLLGTPHYVAPERLRDGVSSEQTDLWSLGATLYAAVEGGPPHRDRQTRHPGPLHDVIDLLITADPAHRFTASGARVLLRDLIQRAVGVHAVANPGRPAGAVRFRPAAVALPAQPADHGPARPTRRFGLLTAGIVVAAVAAAGSIAAAWGHSGSRAAPRPPVEMTAPMTSPCSTPRPLTDTTSPAPISLPEGWLWHVDIAGFALAVPTGWNRGTDGAAVCFSDPGDVRSVTVETGEGLDGEPLRQWRDAERTALDTGALPGYHKVSMGLLLINGGGADWEYSWQPADGPRLHTYRRSLGAGADRAYSLTWTTRDADWNLDLVNQRTIFDGFRDSTRPAVSWTVPGPLG